MCKFLGSIGFNDLVLRFGVFYMVLRGLNRVLQGSVLRL